MKGDRECEDNHCEYLQYCRWHPDDCFGKPWKRRGVYGRDLGGVTP